MRRSSMWKCDGTFKSAPKGFSQVYTLHARHPRGETLPAVHVLMIRKTKADYQTVFRWLNAKLEDEDGSIGALQAVLFDFEPAAREAFKIEFKVVERGIVVRGCRFHYGQAVIRNRDKKGLKALKVQMHLMRRCRAILFLEYRLNTNILGHLIEGASLRFPHQDENR